MNTFQLQHSQSVSNTLLRCGTAWVLIAALVPATTTQANLFNNVLREAKRGGKNVGKTIEKGVRDVKTTSGTALKDIGKAPGKAAEDARKAIEKGLVDASRTVGKAGKDLAAETRRVGPQAVELGTALGKYVERTATGTVDAVQDAERRLSEGKILDAAFHLALDPLTNQEEAAFLATQESGWLNTVATTAALAAYGPGGAAAYASWQTYHASGGNAELAVRAGIITGLTSTAMGGVNGMNASIAKKAVLAGAVGGLAVAASGGNQDQVRDAFILGGGIILIQEGYKNFTVIRLILRAQAVSRTASRQRIHRVTAWGKRIPSTKTASGSSTPRSLTGMRLTLASGGIRRSR